MGAQKLNVNITEGIIWKQISLFALPLLISNFLQQFYYTTDAAIVGKFIGDKALASVGSTGALISMVVGLFMGLATGAGVIIAQYYGAGDTRNLQDSIHTAAALNIVSGVALTFLGTVFAPQLLMLMRIPEEALGMAAEYLRIYFMGILPAMIYNMGAGALRATGDSTRPLYYLIITCIINVMLDLLFTARFKWGVAGAAWATNISQLISAALVTLNLTSTTEVYKLHIKKIKFHKKILISIIKLGFPAGLQSVVTALSNVIIQSRVNMFGALTMAAWTAIGRIDGFIYMPINAFGLAITTFVGQNFGARKYGRVKKSVKVCMTMIMGISVLLSAALTLNGRFMYQIFTDSADVVNYGMSMLYIIVPLYPLFALNEVLTGAIRGLGRSFSPMFISLLGMCAFRIFYITVITSYGRISPPFACVIRYHGY